MDTLFVINAVFPIGQLVASRGVYDLSCENPDFARFVQQSLNRHVKGDWGDVDKEDKMRNREIAQNESVRQTIGDIRVSAWAIAVAVIIGLAAVGWVVVHNN